MEVLDYRPKFLPYLTSHSLHLHSASTQPCPFLRAQNPGPLPRLKAAWVVAAVRPSMSDPYEHVQTLQSVALSIYSACTMTADSLPCGGEEKL